MDKLPDYAKTVFYSDGAQCFQVISDEFPMIMTAGETEAEALANFDKEVAAFIEDVGVVPDNGQ